MWCLTDYEVFVTRRGKIKRSSYKALPDRTFHIAPNNFPASQLSFPLICYKVMSLYQRGENIQTTETTHEISIRTKCLFTIIYIQ